MNTIKIIITIFVSFIFCLLSCAQSKVEDFDKYSQEQEKALYQAFNDKNYDQLLKTLLDWEKQYSLLSPEQQKNNSYLATNAIYYNLACLYSLTKQTEKAIANFKKTLEMGYDDKFHVEEDTDLDNIRKDKRFIKLYNSMPKKDSYTEILQKSGKYVSADTTGLPHFNYEPVTNFRIRCVKEYFNLDSVAGTGDEISKITNLMTWVHNTIRHDGSHRPNCSQYDAMDLYNYYKTTGRGINCRMLAIVLNECYLSMGFKSRFMTCLPQNKDDQDCHVINCVYSKTLDKWVWMDPTFNAYLKDENGNLLSIEEVRTRLIENKTVILNEDANWNNQNKQTKKEYIDNYMAKNLYWFQCPANSYFNIETPYRNSNSSYVSLIPAGYEAPNWNRNVTTLDPAYFWQTPMEN